MLAASTWADWLRMLNQNDWMLCLTVWMTLLTAVIVGLTIAVVVYAKRTLRVTRESLDLFSNPSVTIEGEREACGPYPADNFSGPWLISPRVLLTVCNYSPMEILIPRSAFTFRVLAEESSDPAKARQFSVQKVEPRPGRPVPEGPYVVENTLPFDLTLHGPPVEEGEAPFRLAAEFRLESFSYRGKRHGPLVALCMFLIEHQR